MDDAERRGHDSFQTFQARLYYVLLLGYFRRKPMILDELPAQYRSDLAFISKKYFDGKPVPRKNLSVSTRSRIYIKVLQVCSFKKFDAEERQHVIKFVTQTARYCIDPRYLVDELITYFSNLQISIPKYSALQVIINDVLSKEKSRTAVTLRSVLSQKLRTQLEALASDNSRTLLSTIKNCQKISRTKKCRQKLTCFIL